MKFRSACFLLLAVFSLFVTISPAQSLPFQEYTEKDGLPYSKITVVFQDSKGYIWLGTANGLSRFDGLEFKTYKKENGLIDNFIKTVSQDQSGNIWVGTLRGGVSYLTPRGIVNIATKEGLPDMCVRSIVQDREGVIWFGTDKGLARLQGNQLETYTEAHGLPSNIVNKILVTEENHLWLATRGGICRLADGRFTVYTQSHGLLSNHVSTIMLDSRKQLWCGTRAGVSCFRDGSFTSYTSREGMIDNRVSALMEDADRNIWIGTWRGLSILSGGKFSNYTSRNGLPGNFISSIIRDSEQNAWIASSGGVCSLRTFNPTIYAKKNGLSNDKVKDICQGRNKKIWVGTAEGLNSICGNDVTVYTTKNGLAGNAINAVLENRSGEILAGTTNGLSVLNPENGKVTNYSTIHGLCSNIIFELAPGNLQEREDSVWIGTDKGISRFDSVKKKIFASPFDSSAFEINDLVEDRLGKLWFCTDKGLFRFDLSVPDRELQHFTTADGLPDNITGKLFHDSGGRIWISTASGVSCYDSCYESGRFVNYTTRDGLPGNHCKFIREDRRGNIWIGTTNGLSRFDGTSFKNFTAKQHGLTSNTWYTAMCDSDGTMWFGNAYGITVFNGLPGKPNPVPPPIYIDYTEIPGEKGGTYNMTSLPYNNNSIRFHFTGLCFTAPRAVAYKCRIEGMDSGWMETKNRSIFYPHLPPGQYTFQVKAVNNDGVESTVPASMVFRILPPFWQTWWFYISMGVSGFLLIAGGVRWHFQRAREKLTLKARNRQLVLSQQMELMGVLAASAVHDLKNMLAIIIGYSEIVQEQYDESDENYRYNANIKATANTAVQVVQQILSLARHQRRTQSDVNLSELLNNLLDILEVTTSNPIEIIRRIPNTDILYPINPTRFRQLVLNLCINAVHAMPGGGTLTVTLSEPEPGSISLEIADTGTGIPPQLIDRIFEPMFTTKDQDKGTGLGLFAVKQIVRDHNGKISVHSEPDQGTTFRINFP